MTRLLTRREALKVSGLGLTLGGAAIAGGAIDSAIASPASYPPGAGLTDKNSYSNRLKPCVPGKETLGEDEMRITFLGTWYNPRIAQACNSVFVEVGWDKTKKAPLDQFVFDCGSGVTAKYFAMGISPSRMDKIFLTHIHGDHMSDLTHIYCFGPSMDRKKPLYVWGPTRSSLIWNPPSPPGGDPIGPFDDGTSDYCNHIREAARWHTESFSFQTTAVSEKDFDRFKPKWRCGNATPFYADWQEKRDGYDLVPFELDWQSEGPENISYENSDTGVTITHFPAVHARQGSISYKLEWKWKSQILSMIFTGDTKPNNYVLRQATDGVDVLIHEMASPPEVWVEKFTGLQPGDLGYDRALQDMQNVQNSSHTPQMMLGYILSKLETPPRLAVATHFAATDDVIRYALDDIRSYYPVGEVAVATDLMVINVSKKSIRQRRAVVSDYIWAPPLDPVIDLPIFDTPKYWNYDKGNKVGDPYAQLDPDADIIDPPT